MSNQSYRARHSLDKPYLPLLQDIHFLPSFILGCHRSGTTLLHKLLAATQCFNFVTAYHVIKHDEILSNHLNGKENHAKEMLDGLFKSLDLNNRVLNEVPVAPDMPEEYGTDLGNGGYWFKLTPKTLPRFIELCKKVQFVSPAGRKLLLKNPWDYSNFMYLKSAFPEAKFIFIHRHPIHVINSQLRAARSVAAIKDPFIALNDRRYVELFNSPVRLFALRLMLSSHFDLGLRIVTGGVIRATTYFLQNVGSLPKTDHISVRYEDLCEDPETNVARILQFLGLEQNVTPAYDAFIEPRPIQLLEEVKRRRRSISNKLAAYCAYWKYDL